MKRAEKYAVGVDLGGTNIKIGIVTEGGKLYQKISVETRAEQGPSAVLKQMKKGIRQLLSETGIEPKGIGIGAPGVVSIKKGTVENAPNLPGWGRVHVGKIIEREFGIRTAVENDANAAAIGELIFGAGKKRDSFLMITLGTGVGGGIIMNRKLFRGAFGAAGEIGHVSIDLNGPRCNCGSRGCIEAYIGNRQLIQSVMDELPHYPKSSLHALLKQEGIVLSPKLIGEAAERGDAYATFVIKRSGDLLGGALASAGNLLDISTVIIGGGVSGFGETLFKAVAAGMKARMLKSLQPRVTVVPAKMKNSSGIIGASALVFYKQP